MTTEQQSPTLASIRSKVAQLTTAFREIEHDLDALSILATAQEPVAGSIAPTPDTAVLSSRSAAPVTSRGFRIGSQFHYCWTSKGIYLGVLRHLWSSCPSKREEMAQASRGGARTRRNLAQSPDELFSGRSIDWSRKHSSPIADGWFADTNLSAARMQVILRRVIRAADLPPDSGLEIEWRRSSGPHQAGICTQ